jgi:hypothetical protein
MASKSKSKGSKKKAPPEPKSRKSAKTPPVAKGKSVAQKPVAKGKAVPSKTPAARKPAPAKAVPKGAAKSAKVSAPAKKSTPVVKPAKVVKAAVKSPAKSAKPISTAKGSKPVATPTKPSKAPASKSRTKAVAAKAAPKKPAPKVSAVKSAPVKTAAAPVAKTPAPPKESRKPAKPELFHGAFFHEVAVGSAALRKSRAPQVPAAALRKPKGEESHDELIARIEKELLTVRMAGKKVQRAQVCTKCCINPVDPGFMVDRDTGYCTECALVLGLGHTREARQQNFHPSLMKAEDAVGTE